MPIEQSDISHKNPAWLKLFSKFEWDLVQYNKETAQVLGIDLQKIMKSDPAAAKQFMKVANLDDVRNFFNFVQSGGLDINRFFFFNNFYTRFPGWQMRESVNRKNLHPDIQRMLTEPMIQVEPDIVDEQEKSSKYANQSIKQFYNDIDQALLLHKIEEEKVATLVQQRSYSRLELKKIDTQLHKLLLPVYYSLREQWYTYNDLCN